MNNLKESWDNIFNEIPNLAIPIVSAIYDRQTAKLPFLDITFNTSDMSREYPDGSIKSVGRESRVDIYADGTPNIPGMHHIGISTSVCKHVKNQLQEFVDFIGNAESLVDWVLDNIKLNVSENGVLKNPNTIFKNLEGDVFSVIYFIRIMMRRIGRYDNIHMQYVVEMDNDGNFGVNMPILSYTDLTSTAYYIDIVCNKGINVIEYDHDDKIKALNCFLEEKHRDKMFGNCDKYPNLYFINIDKLTPGSFIKILLGNSFLSTIDKLKKESEEND